MRKVRGAGGPWTVAGDPTENRTVECETGLRGCLVLEVRRGTIKTGDERQNEGRLMG